MFALKDDQIQTYTPCPPDHHQNVVDGVWSGMKLFRPLNPTARNSILYAPMRWRRNTRPATMANHLFRRATGKPGYRGGQPVLCRQERLTATSPLTESDLVDVTSDLIQLGTAEEKAQVQTALMRAGWHSL
jgi:hypothetical protein